MIRQIGVLYVVHEPRMYGANQSLLNLIDGLGPSIKPYVLLPSSGVLTDELARRNVRFFVVDFRHAGLFLRDMAPGKEVVFKLKHLYYSMFNIACLFRVIKALRGIDIDIVHSNTGIVNIGPKIAILKKAKHVWHLREFQDIDHGFKLFESKSAFKRRLVKSNVTICITEAVRDYFDLSDCQNVKVVYNGVRSAHPEIEVNKLNYFLFCGAVKKNKGIEDALDAIAQLPIKLNHIRLKVVGGVDPNYHGILIQRLKDLKITDRVEFLGFRSDVDDLIKNAQALLMCSKNEAMGRVTAEAMLLGCPVIGYDNGGTSEIITTRRNGLLYQEIPELVEHMIYVVDNPLEVQKIITTAQAFAERHFTERSYSKKIYEIYNSLLFKDPISRILSS